MEFGYREVCLDHETGSRHPEHPDRLRAIRRGLARQYGVEFASPPDLEVETAQAVHDPSYLESVREFCADGGGSWDADTVACEATWAAALASAGSAVWTAERALDGATGRTTPFSLGRPPGHHAESDRAMGFCFLNNAAIAAHAALESVDRVAVFDWDVHHGNGTQMIFEDRADVLYASVHQEGLFPGTGDIEETGTGAGEGTTVNLPLPAGAGDPVYRTAFDRLVAPVVERFDPGLVLVSAGFDAHERDPIARMRVSTEGFGLLTARVESLADRVDAGLGFVLEGGYGLESLADGVTTVNETFEGREPAEPEGEPEGHMQERIERARSIHGL
jgi:acetoin utilization deacetylase AcuC-like enzyme